MRILFLYSELMGYMVATLEMLSSEFGAEVTVVRSDTKTKTPYVPKSLERIEYLGRSKFDRPGLLKLLDEKRPDLLYVTGWTDRDYLAVALAARRRGIPVVTGLDNQWRGRFAPAHRVPSLAHAGPALFRLHPDPRATPV